MATSSNLLPKLARRINLTRSVHVLRHVYAPPAVEEGQCQRPPDLQNLQKYEHLRRPVEYKVSPVKVILLEDVEGIGHQFDVVELNRNEAHQSVLLPKKGVYASPFDLEYYGKKREVMKEELAARIRVPYEYLVLGRKLLKELVPVHVSMENKWKISSEIVSASLFEKEIIAPPNTIVLPSESAISGPDFEQEAKLFRFYIVLGEQYVIPMIGRVSHVTTDDTAASLYPQGLTFPSNEQLKKYGLKQETPYFHRKGKFTADDSILDILKHRND
ncbi:unnamed protein product [Bursaphelenchus okinawaensis]|uniref:Large ribosomal subunit protein bL9m n=1 Tax=Bursaphelenchus okinawaensis TaxID=465554 RepID=A0A811JVP0_9BILA|nr:unnamed protein product [Bursaphelenchus okinawaensis]CAG9085922.1 unnamed protein product [Bursaphelenchus okinawaensis]